ncbi:hypothetical protein H4R35_006203 [Dimargaris xerosporica]|nr:hypothetical protein H4R35_006203 [Dimargaris xerosporica]
MKLLYPTVLLVAACLFEAHAASVPDQGQLARRGELWDAIQRKIPGTDEYENKYRLEGYNQALEEAAKNQYSSEEQSY